MKILLSENERKFVHQSSLNSGLSFLFRWLALSIIVVLLITCAFFWQQAEGRNKVAVESQKRAEDFAKDAIKSQARMIFASIGQNPGRYTKTERVALNILATGSDELRVQFLSLLLTEPDALDRMRQRLPEIHRALIGLDPTGSRWQTLWNGAIFPMLTKQLPLDYLPWLVDFAKLPPSDLSEPQAILLSEQLIDRFSRPGMADDELAALGEGAAALLTVLKPQSAANLAMQAGQRLVNRLVTDVDPISPDLSGAVISLVPALPPEEAENLSKVIVDSMVSPKRTHSERFVESNTLKALATKLKPEAAAYLSMMMLTRMGNQEVSNLDMAMLGESLSYLLENTPPQDAAKLRTEAIDLLLGRMAKPKITEVDLEALGRAISVLLDKLQMKVAGALLNRAIQLLVDQIANAETTEDSFDALGRAAHSLAEKPEFEATAELLKPLVERMNDLQTTDSDLRGLSRVTIALAVRLQPAAVAYLTKPLLDRMERPDTTDDALSSIAQAIAGLTESLESEAAGDLRERTAELLVDRMTKPETQGGYFFELSEGISAVVVHLRPEFAAKLSELLVIRIVDPATTGVALQGLCRSVSALATVLQPEPAANLSGTLLNRIVKRTTVVEDLQELAQTETELAKRVQREAASNLLKPLADQIRGPEIEGFELQALGQVASELAKKLEPGVATDVLIGPLKFLVDRMAEAKTSDPTSEPTSNPDLLLLGGTVSALAGNIQSQIAGRLSGLLVERMAKPETNDEDFSTLCETVKALSGQLGSAGASELVMVLTKRARGQDSPELWAASAAQILKQYDDRWMQKTVDFLKVPTVVGESEKALIGLFESKFARDFGGDLGEFVEWAEKIRELDLTSQPSFK
jgi:hypothetical protein